MFAGDFVLVGMKKIIITIETANTQIFMLVFVIYFPKSDNMLGHWPKFKYLAEAIKNKIIQNNVYIYIYIYMYI